jgi:hypothetical protein
MITVETLMEFKSYFEVQLAQTLRTIGKSDSERLIQNKVEGFFIILSDKLIELNPTFKCSCGGLNQKEKSEWWGNTDPAYVKQNIDEEGPLDQVRFSSNRQRYASQTVLAKAEDAFSLFNESQADDHGAPR